MDCFHGHTSIHHIQCRWFFNFFDKSFKILNVSLDSTNTFMEKNKYPNLVDLAETLINASITRTPSLRMMEVIGKISFDEATSKSILQSKIPEDPSDHLKASYLAVVIFDIELNEVFGIMINPDIIFPMSPRFSPSRSEIFALRNILVNYYYRQLAIEKRLKS